MIALVAVFIVDFIFHKKESSRPQALFTVTTGFLAYQCISCILASPAEAFEGMYVSTAAANVMKFILTAGTLVVVIMAQPWLRQKDVADKDGEFYMLVIG